VKEQFTVGTVVQFPIPSVNNERPNQSLHVSVYAESLQLAQA